MSETEREEKRMFVALPVGSPHCDGASESKYAKVREALLLSAN